MGCIGLVAKNNNSNDSLESNANQRGPNNGPQPHGPPPHGPHHYGPPPHGPGRF